MTYSKTKLLLFLSFVLGSFNSFAVPKKVSKVKYRSFFGSCPRKVAGALTLKLVKEFEKSHSLRDVKKLIVYENLKAKHFLEDYKISYDPLKRFLKFSFECPEPLMKVQIYKENGMESYSAILVENGQLFDPTYEVLLRTEKLLKYTLPSLALPVGEIDQSVQEEISRIIAKTPIQFRKRISEVIINENKELTIILSLKNRPSSAFLGGNEWSVKISKLQKMLDYLMEKKKIPSVINLTNAKKVVVKFSDNL